MKMLYGLVFQLIATFAVVEVIGLLWSASERSADTSRESVR